MDSYRTGLLDGSLPGIQLFSNVVLPVLAASQRGDRFGVAAIVRKHSPLLKKPHVAGIKGDQRSELRKAQAAVDELLALWKSEHDPTFMQVLEIVAKTGLFDIPDALQPVAARTDEQKEIVEKEMSSPTEEPEDRTSARIQAWDNFLKTRFSQIASYSEYVLDKAAFGTHQGVKGLEFQRVLVINDDSSARGFLFGYETLLGAKAKSKTDNENEGAGKDSSVSRTRRLLYVTCSRAEESLAIVTYSANPPAVRQHMLAKGWFCESEIELLT